MSIPRLEPATESVPVQNTSLGIDAFSRYVCNTWEEAVESGGPPFDAIIIGSGMYGGGLATKLYRLTGRKILVLEAGPFLTPEHVQNIANIGFNVASEIEPNSEPGTPRELVWGLPWRGNVKFPGLAYCTGGKSVFWGGWCPRLTSGDLSNWPTSTATYLRQNYSIIEEEIGVQPATDFITGPLYDALFDICSAATSNIANIETDFGSEGVEVAPLAVQGAAPAPGLFSFDKYSAMPGLISAIRQDAENSGGNDASRRLFLVPRAHVVKLHTVGNRVASVEVDIDGIRRFIDLPSGGAVFLSASTIESTRIALESFPTALMGRNLQAHVRSDFTVRIRRSAFGNLPIDLETAALLVRGKAPSGRFHLQVTASAHSRGSDALLFHMIPDIDALREQLMNDNPNWITLTIRCVGETHGNRLDPVPNTQSSWIDLSPYDFDEYGMRRAYVNFKLAQLDLDTWAAMDRASLDLAKSIAGSANNIEYLYDGQFQSSPFPLNRSFPEWHRGIGSTYHEAGTLWMGDDPNTSVTNSMGRFHHIGNAYACDQSIFPTVGSVNPVLTGLTLARQLAETL